MGVTWGKAVIYALIYVGAPFEDICYGCLIDGYVLKRMDVMCDCMLIIWIFLIVESEGPVHVFSGFLKHRFEENKFNTNQDLNIPQRQKLQLESPERTGNFGFPETLLQKKLEQSGLWLQIQ